MGVAGSHLWAKIIPTSIAGHGLAPWRLNYACAIVELATKLPGKSVLVPTVGIHHITSYESVFDLGCPDTE
jgi:hypothetical protein